MKKLITFSAAAVMMSVCGTLAMAQAPAPAASEKLFPLGVWYEGGVAAARDNVLPADVGAAAKVYERDFADIEAHGVNVIAVPNSPPEHHKALLDAAERHHLKVILELGLDGGPVGNAIRGGGEVDAAAVRAEFEKNLGPIKSHPALWRVQLIDEPGGGAPMQHYAQVAKVLAEYDAAVKPFCCLAGPGPVEEFLKAVKPDVVAFDFYPFGADNPVNDIKTLRDYENAAKHTVDAARAAGADAWAVIQCHAITGLIRFPTPSETRCMTWLALGTGNRGVFWFLYQSEHFTKDQMMDGLINRKQGGRLDWDEVANLTRELSPLAGTLRQLSPDPDPKNAAQAVRLKSEYPMVDSAGNHYLIAINTDTSAHQVLHLSLQVKGGRVVRLPDNKVFETHPNKDGSTGWSMDFPPGDGAVFRVEGEGK